METSPFRRLAIGSLLLILAVAVFAPLAFADDTEPYSGGEVSGSTLVTTTTLQTQVLGETLPQTGTDADLWLAGGGILLVVGAGLVVAARKPRRRRH